MQAPKFGGRALRILLGLALTIYVTPVYFRIPARITIVSLLLVLALIGVCCVIHALVARRVFSAGPGVGAVVTSGLLIAVFIAGSSGLPIVGHGKGQLAAITFLGVSMIVAGLRAVPGCEVMAIPNLFLGKNADLPCIIFSPLDKLETKLRNKGGA